MIEEIYNYFTLDMLYYWVNFGVLPFWLILIFFPNSNLSRYFVTSIFPILVLTGSYIFILYKSYLMMFWIHFVSINLFTGGWIVKDSQKFSINKVILAIPLILTYLIGPIGLFLYWMIRIFYAKNINLYD